MLIYMYHNMNGEYKMANYPQLNKEVQQGEIKVVMHTNKGDMTFKLFPNIAPKTVENFVTHAKNGYYDGITFPPCH